MRGIGWLRSAGERAAGEGKSGPAFGSTEVQRLRRRCKDPVEIAARPQGPADSSMASARFAPPSDSAFAAGPSAPGSERSSLSRESGLYAVRIHYPLASPPLAPVQSPSQPAAPTTPTFGGPGRGPLPRKGSDSSLEFLGARPTPSGGGGSNRARLASDRSDGRPPTSRIDDGKDREETAKMRGKSLKELERA